MGAAVSGARRLARRRKRIDFSDRVACITGAAGGLGFAIASELGERGARIALVAADEQKLRVAQRRLVEHGIPDVLAVPADLTRPHRARAIVEAIEAAYGRLDVLVNHTGSVRGGRLDHLERADFEDAMQAQFWGPLEVILAALPGMRARGFGRIVNIAPFDGRASAPPAPHRSSQLALLGLSDALRAELGPDGIRVTTVFTGRRGVRAINERRAARQVVDACQYGDAELALGLPARLAGGASRHGEMSVG